MSVFRFASPIPRSGELRLTLALMVLADHLSHLIVGRLAVDLFFLLSGFWISALWMRVEPPARATNFYMNRLLRIWPLYLLVAVFCIFMFPATHITPSTFALLGVATTKGPRAIGVEWSLDVEAQFYLAFPMIFAWFQRFRRCRLAAVLLLSAIGWAASYATGLELSIKYLPMFYAGMMLHERRLAGKTFRNKAALTSLAVFVAVFAVAFALPWWRPEVIQGSHPAPLDTNLFDLLWAATLIPFVGASLTKRSNGLDRAMGDLSYPLYLIHEPVIRILHGASVLGVFLPTSKPFTIAVALAAATTLYLLIDRPIEAWRRRALMRPAQAEKPLRLAA